MRSRPTPWCRWLIVLVVAALIATACGTPQPLALSDEQLGASSTRIRVGSSDPAALIVGVTEWELDHPTARIEIDVRESDDLRRSVLDGNDAASLDVIAVDPNVRTLIRTRPELFLDLDDYVSASQQQTYSEDLLRGGQSEDGSLRAIPVHLDSLAIAMRTDLVPEDVRSEVASAPNWCSVLTIADRFSEETMIAFLGSGQEVARASLVQSPAEFAVRSDGTLVAEDLESLQLAWDLAMLALGEEPIHSDPCPNEDPIQRISRNLTIGDTRWNTAAARDGFAGAVLTYGELDGIAAAAPETAGLWEIVSVPGDAGARLDVSYLAVLATSENVSLAADFVTSLTSPEFQRLAFSRGAPALPTANDIYEDGTVAGTVDEFFGTDPVLPFADAASRDIDGTPGSEREAVIEIALEGIERVSNGNQAPLDAWASVLEEVRTTLG